jgi:excisionase family DNA binding protein
MTSTNQKAGLGVREAADHIGISTNHLRNLIDRGVVPGVVRLGRRIVISRVAIEGWLENGAPTDGA